MLAGNVYCINDDTAACSKHCSERRFSSSSFVGGCNYQHEYSFTAQSIINNNYHQVLQLNFHQKQHELMREKFEQLASHLQDLNQIKCAFVEKYEEMKNLVETVLEECNNDSNNMNFDQSSEKEDFSMNFLDEFIPSTQQQENPPVIAEQESHTGLFDCSQPSAQSIPKSFSSLSLFRCASSESLFTSQQLNDCSIVLSPEHDATGSGSAPSQQSVIAFDSIQSTQNSEKSIESSNVKRHKSAKSHKRKKPLDKGKDSKKIKVQDQVNVQASIDNLSTLTKENIINKKTETMYGEFNWISSFGSFGSAEGQFDGPVDIKYLSRRDLLLVACYNNKNIQIFDGKTLEYKYQISTQSEIRGIALDPTNDNSILVSCDDSIISRYTIMESWHVEMYGSKGCKDNQFNGPTGMVVDEEGRIFVCDCLNSRIVVLSKEGQFLYNFGEKGSKRGQFLMPWSIAIDSFGNLLITDSGRHVIQVYSPSGEHLNEIGRKGTSQFEFNTPRSITVDQITGNVLVCDEENNRVQIFNSNLKESVKIIQDRLYSPTGITLDPTRSLLYVSEWDLEHNFIQVFK